jgi:hypothetical protein
VRREITFSAQRILALRSGTKTVTHHSRSSDSSVTIVLVNKQPAGFKRRKLSTVVRKAITSYYTEKEQMEIEKAAKHDKISKSSFVASAALKEARRIVH